MGTYLTTGRPIPKPETNDHNLSPHLPSASTISSTPLSIDLSSAGTIYYHFPTRIMSAEARVSFLAICCTVVLMAASCPSTCSAYHTPTTRPTFAKTSQHHLASAFVPSSTTTRSVPSRRSSYTSRLYTTSKETNDIIVSEDNITDEENGDDEPWVLRQITFLGLTAPNQPDGESLTPPQEDSASKPNEQLDARNLAEFLMEIGACSVSVIDADANTSNEDPLFDEPTLTACPNDFLADNHDDEEDGEDMSKYAMVFKDAAVGRNLWKRCHVSAHFPSSMFDVSSIVDSIRFTFNFPTNPRYEVDNVPDLDWIKHVQESWNPIVTRKSKFVLRFPWHEDALVMKACQEMEREKMQEIMAKKFSSGVKREGAVVHFEEYDDEEEEGVAASVMNKGKDREYVQIQLEGGIAFGTGEHPTTRLCLDWVRDKVEHKLESSETTESLNFIDYGAGSGVLGISAAAVVRDYNQSKRRSSSGAEKSATVVGVEIDADAIHIANDNSDKNGVEMKNYLPDIESLDSEALSVVLRAMQRKRNKGTIKYLPEELSGPIYDLCAANILAQPLIGLAPTIASLVKSGGEIGLSGVFCSQATSVVEAYKEFFDDVKVAGEENGWVLITGQRR